MGTFTKEELDQADARRGDRYVGEASLLAKLEAPARRAFEMAMIVVDEPQPGSPAAELRKRLADLDAYRRSEQRWDLRRRVRDRIGQKVASTLRTPIDGKAVGTRCSISRHNRYATALVGGRPFCAKDALEQSLSAARRTLNEAGTAGPYGDDPKAGLPELVAYAERLGMERFPDVAAFVERWGSIDA